MNVTDKGVAMRSRKIMKQRVKLLQNKEGNKAKDGCSSYRGINQDKYVSAQ